MVGVDPHRRAESLALPPTTDVPEMSSRAPDPTAGARSPHSARRIAMTLRARLSGRRPNHAWASCLVTSLRR